MHNEHADDLIVCAHNASRECLPNMASLILQNLCPQGEINFPAVDYSAESC